ncbi:hypothetical protein [Peptostreptococcus faecalis]|uniref:hypothetical protein n=1 Tax=Peptostreptococcus faecalis TaxID=2045015 RepID=UPI000C7A52EC|nr:hypothetical protein [Peptostreptococcus faecalis]
MALTLLIILNIITIILLISSWYMMVAQTTGFLVELEKHTGEINKEKRDIIIDRAFDVGLKKMKMKKQ